MQDLGGCVSGAGVGLVLGLVHIGTGIKVCDPTPCPKPGGKGGKVSPVASQNSMQKYAMYACFRFRKKIIHQFLEFEIKSILNTTHF